MLVSSVSELRAVELTEFSSPDAIYRALLATARMPGIAGEPIEIDGSYFVDGAVFESIPFPSAIKGGCTHILVLASRPAGSSIPRVTLFERALVRLMMRKYPGIREGIARKLNEAGNQ